MFFLYLFLWLIISTRLSAEVAVAGVLVSAGVYRFTCKHMRYRAVTNRKILRKLPMGIRYALTLVLETAKANATLFRIVFSPTIEVEPRLIYFRTKLKTNAARVTLANSITLTPGTITVALDGDLLCVHCLSGKIADGIENSIFVRQLQKFEE